MAETAHMLGILVALLFGAMAVGYGFYAGIQIAIWTFGPFKVNFSHGPVEVRISAAPARVLFSDDAHCPGCGHNRDRSAVSTIALVDGRKECQKCGALWSEVERPGGALDGGNHREGKDG